VPSAQIDNFTSSDAYLRLTSEVLEPEPDVP
jgi:hypothetical protein